MCEVIRLDDYRAGQLVGAVDLFNIGGDLVGLDVIAPARMASDMLCAAIENGGHCIHACQLEAGGSTLIEIHIPLDAVEVVLARGAGVAIRDGRGR